MPESGTPASIALPAPVSAPAEPGSIPAQEPARPIRGISRLWAEDLPNRIVGWRMLFGGVILPAICFAIGYPMRPDWQSGKWSDYAQLLLMRVPSLPLYPPLIYCMVCLTLLFINPTRFEKFGIVRLGIAGGVLIAAEYWVVFQLAMGFESCFVQPMVAGGVFVAVWGLGRAFEFLDRRHDILLPGLLVILILVGLVGGFPAVVFVCLYCSTAWALATYVIAALRLFRHGGDWAIRFSLAQMFWILAWFSAHLAAWRMAFGLMLDQYALLPTSPPGNCFICTAAARGYPRWVGVEAYSPKIRVNDQLRTLKALELLLLAIHPRLHRWCRGIYNVAGPWLAARISHPLAATIAYLALKPAEWVARGCLALALPDNKRRIKNLYRWSPPTGGDEFRNQS